MSIRAGRDSDMAGVLGLFFAIIGPLGVPILPENAVIVQKSPEDVVGVRKWPKNAASV